MYFRSAAGSRGGGAQAGIIVAAQPARWPACNCHNRCSCCYDAILMPRSHHGRRRWGPWRWRWWQWRLQCSCEPRVGPDRGVVTETEVEDPGQERNVCPGVPPAVNIGSSRAGGRGYLTKVSAILQPGASRCALSMP